MSLSFFFFFLRNSVFLPGIKVSPSHHFTGSLLALLLLGRALSLASDSWTDTPFTHTSKLASLQGFDLGLSFVRNHFASYFTVLD